MRLFLTLFLLAALAPLSGAKTGNVHAQRILGAMYRQDQGVAKDGERARFWTREAVMQGDGSAQFNLANMYEAGDMVAKNLPLAAKWYEQAARADIPLAQYRLGVFYLEGLAGTRDRVRAFV